jgi:hypothetical protein
MASRGRHAARAPVSTALVLLSLVVAAAAVARSLPRAPATVIPDGEPVATPGGGWAQGLLTFRGSPERAFLGRGPVPAAPEVRWKVPERKLCSRSAIGLDGSPLVEWCGTGWTGQPNVVPGAGGVEIREGAYDGAYHFLGGDGEPVRPPLHRWEVGIVW